MEKVWKSGMRFTADGVEKERTVYAYVILAPKHFAWVALKGTLERWDSPSRYIQVNFY